MIALRRWCGTTRRSLCENPANRPNSAAAAWSTSETPDKPHPLQAAFIAEQVPQCGYCLNGWIMTAAALLRDTPHASETDLRDGLSGLKCRCGAHLSIIRAIARVTAA